MRKICFVMMGILCLFRIVAQTQRTEFALYLDKEGQIKAMPKPKQFKLDIPVLDFNSYQPATTSKLDFLMMQVDADYMSTSLDERPMNMQILSLAYRPYFNVYAPMLRKVSPMAFDFIEVSATPLSEKTSFYVSGSQQTWPGLGAVNTVSTHIAHREGAFTLVGGGTAGRYFTPFNPHPGFLATANLQLIYDPTEWMRIRTWGQYAYYYATENPYNKHLVENDNPHIMLNPFMPHTSVGTAMEFKLNDNVGVGVGVNYQYNHWQNRMERQVLLYPVFRSNQFKISFY